MNDKAITTDTHTTLRRGLRAGIPIGLGYFAVSFAFGLMAREGGLSVFQATLISLLNLTSAGQFAGLTVILSAGSYSEIMLTQLVINLRYALMSFSLSQSIDRRATLAQRMIVAFGVTDEIYAVTEAEAKERKKDGALTREENAAVREEQAPAGERGFAPAFSYGAMSVAIPGWVLGTACGALLGSVLPQILLQSLSVALYGMFIAIIIPPAGKERPVLFTVVFAMALSTLFSLAPVLRDISAGFTIILVTLTVSVLAALLFPVRDA